MNNEVENKEEKPLFAKKEKEWKWNLKTIFFTFFWLAPLLIIIDQATKWSVVNAFSKAAGNSVTIIPDFFFITLTYNKGSSFGMGSEVPFMRFVFIAISWIASTVMIYFWVKNIKKYNVWIDVIFALCVGGALGNAIDRTFYWNATVGFEGVIDFLHFRFFETYDFAIFNFADACLSVGVVLLLVYYLVVDIIEKKKKGKTND